MGRPVATCQQLRCNAAIASWTFWRPCVNHHNEQPKGLRQSVGFQAQTISHVSVDAAPIAQPIAHG